MGLPVNSIVQISYEMRMYNQRMLTTLHYRVAVPSSTIIIADEMEDLAERFRTNGANDIFTAFAKVIPIQVSIQNVVAQPIYPVRYRRVVLDISGTGQGEGSTVPNVQAALTFYTIFSGRNQVGGVRIPAPPVEAEQGVWNVLYKNFLNDLADKLTTFVSVTAGGGSYTPVVYHRSPNANPKYTDLAGGFAQDTSRVMRRRTVGVGE